MSAAGVCCLIAWLAGGALIGLALPGLYIAWRYRSEDPLIFPEGRCRGGEFPCSQDHHLRHSGVDPARPGGDRTSGIPTWSEWSAGEDGEGDR